MMRKLKYVLFIILTFTLAFLGSCSGDDDEVKDINSIESLVACINDSMSKPYQVVTTTSINDGQTEVYKSVTSIAIESNETLSATITIETYKLNDNFTLEKSTNVERVSNLKTDTLFTYKLNSNYFTSYDVNNDGLISTVKASSAKDLLNSSSVEVSNDFPLNITLTNRRITNLSLSYKMDQKDVSVSTIYSYAD